jgi:hypothetical protein
MLFNLTVAILHSFLVPKCWYHRNDHTLLSPLYYIRVMHLIVQTLATLIIHYGRTYQHYKGTEVTYPVLLALLLLMYYGCIVWYGML